MSKAKMKNGLKSQMLKMTIIPLVLMTIIVVATCISGLYKSSVDQSKLELNRDSELVEIIYDEVYAGDFRFEPGEDGQDVQIFKGEQRINGDYIVMDDLADVLDVEITIFYEDKRILTTLVDENGQRAMGTSAAAVVKKDVLEGGKPAFYTNVMVYDDPCYAYYKPLIDEDGKVFGMIAVCRPIGQIQKTLMKYLYPVIAACIVIALLIGTIMVNYNKKLANRVGKMNKYMNNLANGDFDLEMPRELMKEDDEIKRLATDGKRMAHSLKMLVEYDALTELNNRRYADKKLEEMRVRSVENGEKFCVCIADIDFFKKVNDTYGHEMGDTILKSVADKLKAGMVGKGVAARWGGEEFLLLFVNRELDIARRELEIIMNDVRTIYVPDTDRQITMSFGLTYMLAGENVDDTLKRADSNLYEAKEGGRNQIVCK